MAIPTPLTTKQTPSKVEWTEEGKIAFRQICNTISQSCSLCIPLPQDIFSLVTDASGLGIGGVLQVQRDGRWEVAAFFSRQLRGAEQRYSATELEALALVATIEHFGYYLYGRCFQVFTDHKPLVQLTTFDRLNPRLRRFAFKLQHWMLEIVYLPGRDNTLADALSREERRQRDARDRPGRLSSRGGCGGTASTRRRKKCRITRSCMKRLSGKPGMGVPEANNKLRSSIVASLITCLSHHLYLLSLFSVSRLDRPGPLLCKVTGSFVASFLGSAHPGIWS